MLLKSKLILIGLMVLLSNTTYSQSQKKLVDTCRYAFIKDTGYVFYSDPHYLCSFIKTNTDKIENIFVGNSTLETYFLYNDLFKRIIIDDLDSLKKNDSNIVVYRDGGVLTKKFDYFKAAITVRLCLNSNVRYINKSNKSNYFLRSKNKKVFLVEKLKTYNFIKECVSVDILQ